MASWSGHWNDVHSDGHSLLVNHSPAEGRINLLFRKSRTGMRSTRALLVLGANAIESSDLTADTYKRVQGDAYSGEISNLGGARTIETRTIEAAGTATAAQEAQALRILTTDSRPASYPTDASGNGGGGKAGGF